MAINQLPTKGTKNWGTILNSWLGQLGPASLGGIHNGDTASRPAGLTVDDEGRVYIDTESQELLRWDGSAWQVLLTGNQEQKFNITAKTADYTITTEEAETGLNGFGNDGATGTVKFTLPDAVAGMKVTIVNGESQTLQVQSVNDDKIHTINIINGTKLLINNTKASVVELYCINNTEWVLNGIADDWTDNPSDCTADPSEYAGQIKVGWIIGGGIVFQTDGTNGLIMANEDETDQLWCTAAMEQNANSITDGASNTAGLSNSTFPAANTCASKVLCVLSDWYLPAKDQLDILYQYVQTDLVRYNFTSAVYWSSTVPFGGYDSWSQDFNDGSQSLINKQTSHKVRAIRSF